MSLKKQALRGVKWTTLSAGVLTIVQLAQLAILTRVLTPKDFGLMAILTVVIGFSQAFMDMGISNAIIQRKSITHTQLSSLYWLNIASGIVLCIAVVAIAPLVAIFYKEPRIETLLVWLSFVFVIVAVGNQYRVLCQKELQFDRMAKIGITAGVGSFAVAVFFAVGGYGVYALVFAALMQAFISSFLFLAIGLREHHRPALIYQHSGIKDFYSFGLFQMGERTINYISANIDKLLIGKMIGMQAVGFYDIAWRLIIFPLQAINPIVNTVAFPLYSKVQEDKSALQRYYTFNVKVMSLMTIPLLAFLVFFANDIVLILFGPGWKGVASLVNVLAFVGILKALGSPGGAILLAKGRADIGFWWNVFWAAAVAATVFIVLRFVPKVEMVAYSLLALSLSVGMIWHYLIAKFVGLNYWPIVLHFFKIIVISLIIGWLGAWVADMFVSNNSFFRLWLGARVADTFLSNNAFFHLMVGGLEFLIIYLVYLMIFEKEILNTIKRK